MATSSSGAQAAGAATLTETTKARKPTDSRFKQQRLPAWQAILTAGTVLPTFFVIGIAFIPIGIGMLWFSENVRELEMDYTDCISLNPADDGASCASVINGTEVTERNCNCQLEFELKEDWEGEIYVYYGLENFFQNHRRYVKSRDDNQLLGQLSDTPSDSCQPFDKNASDVPYVPCGAIANSLFSDVITLQYLKSGEGQAANYVDVPVLRTGIAWTSDRKFKFKNPELEEGQTLEDVFSKYAKPQAWKKNLWELDPENEENNGLQNEDLIVWMRTAALPNFRKLYRRINHTAEGFNGKLPKNKYRFEIEYNFEVRQFAGKKKAVISTTSVLGGKNPFLGIAYIVVGCICLILGVVFLFVHIKYGKQLTDLGYETSAMLGGNH